MRDLIIFEIYYILYKRGDFNMLLAKSRLQGKSVVLTLPVGEGKRPDANKEYIVIYEEDGTITLIPKVENPFASSNIGELYNESQLDESQYKQEE